jgi:hypothetical protein
MLGGVLFQKETGGYSKTVFKSQDIIRRQKLVQISAALVETGDML